MPEEENVQQKLFAKLAKAQEEVGTVEKKGRNDHQHYNYVRAEDAISIAKDALKGAGLIVTFDAEGPEITESPSGSMITLVRGHLTLTDPDTGFSHMVDVVGAGADKPGDKGAFKAMTGARKYALIHLLDIPIGDDPEAGEQKRQKRQSSSSSGGVLAPKRVDQVFKLIGVKLTPAGYKGSSLPDEGFKRLGVMFGSISAERPAVNRSDSIKKGLRGLSPSQADQLAKLLEGEGTS